MNQVSSLKMNVIMKPHNQPKNRPDNECDNKFDIKAGNGP